MLVVLDTNIFVSAAITPAGTAGRVVRAGVSGQFDYAVCPAIVSELTDVLAGGRFGGDPAQPGRMSRDPDDDYVVAFAVVVGADAIVSGDADLLDLGDAPVPIMNLRAFAGSLEDGDET